MAPKCDAGLALEASASHGDGGQKAIELVEIYWADDNLTVHDLKGGRGQVFGGRDDVAK